MPYAINRLKELLDDHSERHLYSTENGHTARKWMTIKDGKVVWEETRLILEDLEDDTDDLRHFIAEKEREMAESGLRVLRGKPDNTDEWWSSAMLAEEKWQIIKIDIDNGRLRDHLRDLHAQHARTYFRAQSDVCE